LQVTGPPEPLAALPEADAGAAAGVAGAAAAAGAAAGADADADLSMPPWPLQAPRPPCGEVVPSLHLTGVLVAGVVPGACAGSLAGAAPSAAAHSAPQRKVLSFVRFISRSP
jgi:hypothetical protein